MFRQSSSTQWAVMAEDKDAVMRWNAIEVCLSPPKGRFKQKWHRPLSKYLLIDQYRLKSSRGCPRCWERPHVASFRAFQAIQV